MTTKNTSQAGERTHFKVGQLVTVTEARSAGNQGRAYSAEIIEDMKGGYFRLEVDTEEEKHEFWTAHESRMESTQKEELSISIIERKLSDGSPVYSVVLREARGMPFIELDAINYKCAMLLRESISSAIQKTTNIQLA